MGASPAGGAAAVHLRSGRALGRSVRRALAAAQQERSHRRRRCWEAGGLLDAGLVAHGLALAVPLPPVDLLLEAAQQVLAALQPVLDLPRALRAEPVPLANAVVPTPD